MKVQGNYCLPLLPLSVGRPESSAILAPGRKPLSYSGLSRQIESTVAQLRAAGIEREDRVALLVPNGPEAATAVLAIAAACQCAPLDPNCREAELQRYLDDLRPGLIVYAGDSLESKVQGARAQGIASTRMRVDDGAPAGMFSLPDLPAATGVRDETGPAGRALLLYTSGTTARSKLVPLTWDNLNASARNVVAALQLTAADRCLNVMPLFHIHGLVAGVLASLRTGASVVCTPGFPSPLFFEWMDEFAPTWYTAAPGIHESILAQAPRPRESLNRSRLRVVRSSSAPLAAAVLYELEATLRVPVVVSYGMTEAAHQVAANPLPPGVRKAGSVGCAAGPELTVLDAEGCPAAIGTEGEVCIRGASVTAGYVDNPRANQESFRNGWFHTGDLGRIDQDGYLFLTGRSRKKPAEDEPRTIYDSLLAVAQVEGTEALLGTGRRPMTHRGLVQQIARTVEALNSLGIGRGDRVVTAVANGPEAAALCLAVACGAIAAPLNPASLETEFEACFSNTNPRALIVEAHSTSACVAVAESKGIPVIRLVPDTNGPGGSFILQGSLLPDGKAPTAKPGFAEPEDVALLIHTSGSTSRPKIAPLTHSNLCHGAMSNVQQLRLSSHDKCLCITPMFFTQGILVSVFSSLAAGGSVVCTPGYDPLRFFAWLDEFKPTWYAAPTAVQRSILANAPRHAGAVARAHLRVIRCSSAIAAPDFLAQMETLFRAPVLDSYGLTETSSTIAGERMPPAVRKRGSVGTAIGCKIAIIADSGEVQHPGQAGEVIVQGPGVIQAYEGDMAMNRKSFVNGWLRTGDLGMLDGDGYLFLTGRSKEIINRGGEKIAPHEIDDVLMEHPAVEECLTFALPDSRLGEEIGVVVMRGAQADCTEIELQRFAASRLADARVPRRVFFVDDIPRGQTGKFQRIGLAQKMGLTEEVWKARPAGAPEADAVLTSLVARVMAEVLGLAAVKPDEAFFDMGGDSLLATRLLFRLEQECGRTVGLVDLFQSSSAVAIAARLGENRPTGAIVAQNAPGTLPPMYCLGAGPLFIPLANALSPACQFLTMSTLRDPTGAGIYRLEALAATMTPAILTACPRGPLFLAGWSLAGILAVEVAHQLEAAGCVVAAVVLFDSLSPVRRREWFAPAPRRRQMELNLMKMIYHAEDAMALGWMHAPAHMWRKFRDGRKRARYDQMMRLAGGGAEKADVPLNFMEAFGVLAAAYTPRPVKARLIQCRPAHIPRGGYYGGDFGWSELGYQVDVVNVPGDHNLMFQTRNAKVLAAKLIEILKTIPF